MQSYILLMFRVMETLDIFTELGLVLTGVASWPQLNIASCSYKNLNVLFVRSLLVLSGSGAIGCNDARHLKLLCFKRVMEFSGFFLKSDQCCKIDGIS